MKITSPGAPLTDLSRPVAQGRTAEIFPWDEGHVLKLYRDWCPPGWVDYDARIARAVHAAGIPSPAAGEIVEVRGRRGLVYERLQGVSMLHEMNARPWLLWKYARLLAELHVQIHQRKIAGLPTYKDRLRRDIVDIPEMPEGIRRSVLHALDALPDADCVCHGDYHPGNILLTPGGPVVIDWMTACSGSPWADVARTSLLLDVGAKAAGKQVSPLLLAAVGFYHRLYVQRYRALRPEPGDEGQRWRRVVAAARLTENILPERETLMKIVKEGAEE